MQEFRDKIRKVISRAVSHKIDISKATNEIMLLKEDCDHLFKDNYSTGKHIKKCVFCGDEKSVELIEES